ncbi:MAG: M1 family metallopeptidase [Bacteroidota bacterium]
MKQLVLFVFLLIALVLNAQNQDKVDFTHAQAQITLFPETKSIQGKVTYTLDALKDVDSVFLDAKNMTFSAVSLNKKKAEYTNSGKVIWIYEKLKKGKSYTLSLHFSAKPMQTLYFLGFTLPDSLKISKNIDSNTRSYETIGGKHGQIWTQGQGKYTSHWLPSFDNMEEKVEFDLSIGLHTDYQVIANGKFKKRYKESGKTIWAYDMQRPMSSYLLAFAIGKYVKEESTSASGIPLENYYYPKDSLKLEPTYRHTKEIFDFLETEIGVPYPWQNYKQVPVRDFLYAGMENTGTTIFSDQYVIDSTGFIDKNYVNVNAHEMAHQWFGNLVTEKNGEHHWLHEGFATYYAYLAEQHLYGDDHFYWKLYKTLQRLKEQADKGQGQSLLDPKASSLTFYEKGAWALFMLRNKIGDAPFKKGIKEYLKKYAFKNVTVPDFLNEMERAYGDALDDFEAEWLLSSELPFEKAKKQLAQVSPSIALLFRMEAELGSAQGDDFDYQKYWDATSSVHLKKRLIRDYGKSLSEGMILKAFASDTIPIRQAVLLADQENPRLDQNQLESFLSDKSYINKETALFALWQRFPENRKKYLDRTRGIMGLPHKNVRLLWLTLAIMTEGYEGRNTQAYFEELSGYSDASYNFEIRQGAFFYLKEAFGFDDQSLINLMKATGHHSWQFRKYARNLVDELWNDMEYKTRMENLLQKLNVEEARYLNTKVSSE